MKIIKAEVEIIDNIDGVKMLKKLERIGRVCYKSEERITEDSYKRFIENIIKRGHESVLEHESITVKFICDRAVANELVRHRLASFTQESTRYCNYSQDKFNNEITVVEPPFFEYKTDKTTSYDLWKKACELAETQYLAMFNWGCTPEQARDVLPLSTKTEIVVTANLREWRHILKLRCNKNAHPQMRELMLPLLKHFKMEIPVIFDDVNV